MTGEVLLAVTRHAKKPGRSAIIGGGTHLDYAELHDAIARTAEVISSACSEAGPVAVMMDNCPASAVIDLALAHLGRANVPIPGFFADQQRAHALAACGARYLILQSSTSKANAFEIAGRAIAISALDSPPVALPARTAKVTFTSGSTGNPKGVCLSQETMDQTAAAIMTALGSEYAGKHCAVLPLSILLENVAGLYANLLAGGCYVAEPLAQIGFANQFAPDFGLLTEALRRVAATSAILVPEILRGLVHTLEAKDERLPALRFLAVGGASVSARLLARAEALKLPVYEGYGLSEAGSVVSLNVPGAQRVGTVGRLLPHVRATIAEDGELIVESPRCLGFTGGKADATHLATGDIVTRDTDGFLKIVGRKSARIITSFGRNIAPEWVESELLAHPAISQTLVYGEGASALSALIVPASSRTSPTEIVAAIAAANAKLPSYARVTAWRPTSRFSSENGQLTSNGRLRREAIHKIHELGKFAPTERVKAQ